LQIFQPAFGGGAGGDNILIAIQLVFPSFAVAWGFPAEVSGGAVPVTGVILAVTV